MVVVPLEAVDSADLEARACAGDASAFGELIRVWDHDLRGVVWTVVRSSEATDEVMKRSYENAFGDIARFDQSASLKTWLHTVCLRNAIEHGRTEAPRTGDGPDGAGSPQPGKDMPAHADVSTVLGQVFDSLEPVDQVLLMLTAGLGHSFDETATIVGMQRGTVASRVGRARVELRNRREA